ncbi:MAG: hypothetical protein QM679_07130 [Patulibacter sp.]
MAWLLATAYHAVAGGRVGADQVREAGVVLVLLMVAGLMVAVCRVEANDESADEEVDTDGNAPVGVPIESSDAMMLLLTACSVTAGLSVFGLLEVFVGRAPQVSGPKAACFTILVPLCVAFVAIAIGPWDRPAVRRLDTAPGCRGML